MIGATKKMAQIDTGSNPTKGTGILKRCTENLIIQGCKLLHQWRDIGGVWGYDLKYGDFVFILVARSTPAWRQGDHEIVSAQKVAVLQSQQMNRALVMAMPMKESHLEIGYWVFLGDQVYRMALGENMRGQVVMVNFSITLGKFSMRPREFKYLYGELEENWRLTQDTVTVQKGLGAYFSG